MTKVVTYLFDNMFKRKERISFTEKAFVVGVAIVIVTTAVLFVV